MPKTATPFRALLWKEYRESKIVFYSFIIIAAAAGILFSIYPLQLYQVKSPLPGYSIHVQLFLVNLFAFALALFFFLPLFSRETERSMVSFLYTRPLPIDTLHLNNWISAYVLAAFPLLIHILFITIVNWIFFHQYPIYLANLSLVSIASLTVLTGCALLCIYGLIFFFFSSLSPTRLLSFLISIIGIVLFFILIEEIDNRAYQSPESIFNSAADLLKQYMFLLVSSLAIILFIASLGIARFRVTAKCLYGTRYALIAAVIPILTVGYVYTISTNINIQQTSSTVLTKDEKTYLFEKFKETTTTRDGMYRKTIHRGDTIVRLEGITGLMDEARQRFEEQWHSPNARLIIEKRVQGETKEVFNRTLEESIQVPLPGLPPQVERQYFTKAEGWYVLFADTAGILTRHISIPVETQNEDEPERKYRSSILALHVSLQDPVQCRPVEQIELTYHAPQGIQTKVLESEHPGFFLTESLKSFYCDFDHYVNLYSYEYDLKSLPTDVEFTAKGNEFANVAASRNMLRMLRFGILPGYSPYRYSDTHLYNIEFYHDDAYRYWPIISSIDVSNPTLLRIATGANSMSPMPVDNYSLAAFGIIGLYQQFDLDQDTMILTYSSLNNDYVSLYDLNDMAAIHETARIPISKWNLWTNWPLYHRYITPFSFEFNPIFNMRYAENKIVQFSSNTTRVFTIENNSMKPKARLIQPSTKRTLVDVAIQENLLITLWSDDRVETYRITSLD